MEIIEGEAFGRACKWGFWLVIGLLSLGCSAVQFVEKDKPFALLEVDCEPKDAAISIDGKVVGVAASFRDGVVPVLPGHHRVEISREGYLPYFFDLEARPGRSYRLELDLLRDIDQELDERELPERGIESMIPKRW